MPVEHVHRLFLPLDAKRAETLKRWAKATGKTVQAVALDAIYDVCELIEASERNAELN